MSKSSKPLKIKPGEIQKVIGDYNLHIYKNIWHYSFNEEFQKNNFIFETRDNKIVCYSKPLNIFAPLLVYTNSENNVSLQINNAIHGEFDQKNESSRHVFWFLRTSTFQDFLERRSRNSSQPKCHFPTLETYEKLKKKVNGEVTFNKFNEEFFIKHYNILKNPAYLSGEEVFLNFRNNNPSLNFDWLYTAVLRRDSAIVAIAAIVDDGKSFNLENMAAKRSSIGLGIFLCAEIVKYCCKKKYYSFDAGVSGIYGNFKQKIFLDSREVFKEPEKITRYFSFWEQSFWTKVIKILTH